ncbi:MAG: hypothetical protein KDC02_25460, partial [Flavobacteriales bacterium]|nr:hypothetical protein [Flavobacteriales bacterium]
MCTGEEQPGARQGRQAMRLVVRHCIYGVDLNPLAVELCKVALWLEAHIPGEPLNFLDHRIKCGNAIVGFAHREELEKGVPDEAFKALPEDDKAVAKAFRDRNKTERKQRGQTTLDLDAQVAAEVDQVMQDYRLVERLPERTPEEVEAKQKRFQKALEGDAFRLNQVAAIPIAQFYIPKTPANRDRLITDATYQAYLKQGRQLTGPATAMAWATAERKRFFHWFIEFPEVMAQGGFDCILGNPPYLGTKRLTSTYGHSFCQYVQWQYHPAGLSDLVVFFFRRIHKILRKNGFMSIITTNSIKDGRIREDGLEVILHQDSEIVMATRSVKWPGKANLMVSLISIINGKWSGTYLLDNRAAQRISSFLEEEGEQTAPDTLLANMNRGYKGSQLRGDGFILTKDEANMLIEIDERNSAVISIIVNGQEMTSDPMQDPERLVIDFKEMSYADASNYSLPFGRVQELVKPIRDALNPNMPSNRRVKEYWWQYEVSIRTLYDSIASHSLCFGAVVTSKYLAFSALPTDWVFTNSLYILTSDHWDHFAVVQCTLHEVWARKYSGSLKQDLRYSPSKCFDTFPFPAGQWETANATLAKLGERYHAHRKELMRHSWLGLTKVYNLFHDPLLREATEEELGMPLNAFG